MARRDPGRPVKLAIVGPSFFSYVDAIATEFRSRGIDVVEFDERHSNRLTDKILYRLGLHRHKLSRSHAHIDGIAQAIRSAGCTDVLLANVEAVDRGFVERLVAAGIHAHLYMWDGVHNKPGYVSYLDAVSSKGTFDPSDADRFGMVYIPLFAEPTFDRSIIDATGPYTADIGFCGTVHSSRTKILARLRKAQWAKPIRLRLMLYYHSRPLLYLKGLLDPSAWKIAAITSSKPFSKAQIARMFGETRFILDVPHPGQRGMTARTFEVLLSGARLLTFNRQAATLPASLLSRVRIVDRIEEVRDIDFASLGRLPDLSPDERYYLSLGRFVDQLTAMMGLAGDAPGVSMTKDPTRRPIQDSITPLVSRP